MIRFENGQFLPYYSGANATVISEEGETAYPDIRYFAKSAMSNWTGIGPEYEKMLKGKSGDGQFPDYRLEYLSGVNETTGEEIWSPVPDVMELNEEDTIKPGEKYRGQIVFRIKPILFLNVIYGFLYDDTDLILTSTSKGPQRVEDYVLLTYPLDPGVHHVGIELDWQNTGTGGVTWNEYIDFRRVKVIYEPEDLSGKWEGAWQIRSADIAQKYIREMIVKLIMLFGVDEATAQEAAAAGIQEDPNLYNDRPLTIIFEKIDPNSREKYRIQAFMSGDHTAFYEGEATYREGILTFKARAADNTLFEFTGSLSDEDTLTGSLRSQPGM